ncbi:hypothetical protein [Steroidobacter sp.]|uniref:hypothetical protein n=1 Tax=Steroidobacter sp. TaxID=1978227 RepID=UPI001A478B5F|nr:hypothetical protein [Steroidobacter sp.]MBL8267521.1 hypothetical protein [Steroidobacter sp.]
MGLFSLFKKRAKPQDRYLGKPLLKLVDSFVLECIGELDPKSEAGLRAMEPKLQQIYNCSGTWEDIIIAQLQFDPNIRTEIREMWLQNQEIAKEHNRTLSPLQFVEMFVEKNVTSA